MLFLTFPHFPAFSFSIRSHAPSIYIRPKAGHTVHSRAAGAGAFAPQGDGRGRGGYKPSKPPVVICPQDVQDAVSPSHSRWLASEKSPLGSALRCGCGRTRCGRSVLADDGATLFSGFAFTGCRESRGSAVIGSSTMDRKRRWPGRPPSGGADRRCPRGDRPCEWHFDVAFRTRASAFPGNTSNSPQLLLGTGL